MLLCMLHRFQFLGYIKNHKFTFHFMLSISDVKQELVSREPIPVLVFQTRDPNYLKYHTLFSKNIIK